MQQNKDEKKVNLKTDYNENQILNLENEAEIE